MRLLICGDRNWTDYEFIKGFLDNLPVEITVIIHGCAKGVDTFADQYAKEKGIEVEEYPADWDNHGKAAGPIRNLQMLINGQPDAVIAFHNDIEKSAGTKDMVKQSRKAGVWTTVVSEGEVTEIKQPKGFEI